MLLSRSEKGSRSWTERKEELGQRIRENESEMNQLRDEQDKADEADKLDQLDKEIKRLSANATRLGA